MTVERVAPDLVWDSWLEACGLEADYLQTGRWAEINLAANGRQSAAFRYGASTGALVSWSSGARGELTCLYGPVVADGAADSLGPLLEAIETFARQSGCIEVRLVGRPPLSRLPLVSREAQVLRRGYEKMPWCTSVVDLSVGDEDLLRRCHRAVGKAVRRCLREGVTVRRCSDLDEFERLFLPAFAASRADYDPQRDRVAFEVDAGGNHAYFVALTDTGDVLATLGTYRFAGVAREIMSGRTPLMFEGGLPAQDLLHWDVMRYHRGLGDSCFDLAGYAPAPATPKEAGIRRFKEKWGGTEVPSPIYTKAIGRPVRRFVRRLRTRVV